MALSFQEHKIIIYSLIKYGLPYTLKVASITLLLSLTFGIILGIIRSLRLPVIHQLLALFAQVSRGVPGIIILFFLYSSLPYSGSPLFIAVLALTFIQTAYIMEIIKGGLNSINKGQWEAAKSLSMSLPLTLIHIIIPQVMLVTLPAIVGQLVMLIKGTALASVIGGVELTRHGTMLLITHPYAMIIYAYVLIIYFIVCRILTIIGNRLEKSFVRRIIGDKYGK